MSGAPIINGLMIFFSLTTVAVIAYPLVKLLPSWLERRVYRNIAFHRDAVAALGVAIDRAGTDAEQQARLQRQHDYHRAALAALAPDAAMVSPPAAKVDAAA